ncbi:hypothetical protein HMPREF1861_02329 [Corynebacterium kroppenstedtii]|nr:hypothetical protein HMPREF1861_02329 [Corynebacterium kroppenstedtii]
MRFVTCCLGLGLVVAWFCVFAASLVLAGGYGRWLAGTHWC